MRIGIGMGVGGGGGAPPWTPAALGSALELWLRADASAITLNGSTVSAWADQSTKARNASQGTAAKQPTYVSSVASLNGQPALLFDGADDSISTAAGAAVAQPSTLMVVARPGVVVATMTAVDGPVGGGNRHIIGTDATKKTQAYAGSVLAGALWADSTPQIAIFQANGGSSALYVNSHSTAAASGAGGALEFVGANVGSSGAAQYWVGHVAEVVCVAGASATIRENLARYASSRYAIALT